jgi:hypothetical protein
MPSPLANSKIHFNRVTFLVTLYIAIGCNRQTNLAVTMSPIHFKVQVPFILDSRGIIINTYWGSENVHHVLCLDNYSPSWLKSSVTMHDSISNKSRNLKFNTYTADGTSIMGEVGVCNRLAFENITFKQVPFYIMPSEFTDNKNDDGVFGGDLMSTGIWKIDFKRKELTFTSSIDSLKGIKNAEVFPATFGREYIKINVIFGNNTAIPMAIDLGYNGDMILPLNDFNHIYAPNKTSSGVSVFKTPARLNIVNSISFIDTVRINHDWFNALISSNEEVKERLIGLQFFERFDFVIFDFLNKTIYLPKKVW